MKAKLDWSKIVKLDIFIHPEMGYHGSSKKEREKESCQKPKL